MTASDPSASGAPQPPSEAIKKDHGRAGRDLPTAVGSAVVLVGAILLSLLFWKTAFMAIVAAAVVVAIWELHQGLGAKDIDIPEQPLMLGGVVMVVVAYFWGAPALVTATAVTALVIMLWLLRRGVDGYVKNATAAVFTLVYVPFLGSFVALLLSEGGHNPAFGLDIDDDGVRAIIVFIAITVASDTGGYVAGVLFGKHPMAPGHLAEEVVGGLRRLDRRHASPSASGWSPPSSGATGGSACCSGSSPSVMATLGDLCESVIKRDLGIKDMSQVIPGHGGLMDRLDSLLATVAPIWLVLHYLVF